MWAAMRFGPLALRRSVAAAARQSPRPQPSSVSTSSTHTPELRPLSLHARYPGLHLSPM
jgi:hypothetical protein